MAIVIENTSRTLLSLVAQGDDSAWYRFFEQYKVLVYLRGRAWHFNDADTEDLLIKVMEKFHALQGRLGYDPAKGRFRDYFSRMVRNAAADMMRSRKSHPELPFDSDNNAAERLPDSAADRGDSFQRDWQARIFAKAYEAVRQEVPGRALQCWTSVNMEHVPANKVAVFQGISLATVYNDCNLVWGKLKALAARLTELEDCPQ